MKNKNIYDNIFEKCCAVCGHKYMADIYDQGECPNCGWYNGKMYNEFPDQVIFSNLISLNKAKQLYKAGKNLNPSLEDFLDAFNFYGETCFIYKSKDCCLFRGKDEDEIEFGWSPDHIYYFKNKEDFIQNAKIGNELVRDIWNKIEDPRYL